MSDNSTDLSEFALKMDFTRLANVWFEVCVGIIEGARNSRLTGTMLAAADF